jgi:hypothetical protein
MRLGRLARNPVTQGSNLGHPREPQPATESRITWRAHAMQEIQYPLHTRTYKQTRRKMAS